MCAIQAIQRTELMNCASLEPKHADLRGVQTVVSDPLVDRSTTGFNLGGFGGFSVDGRPVLSTRHDTVDEFKHLAKVRVAGSNPVFRSKEIPGRGGFAGSTEER